ncbi:hypothetical protein DXG03_005074 [Asterophora parasitica]|uniref:Uncharacterized protein n=1 Tax=Asterophora parasitica TaxID=117018 RepID=A0A9P7G6P8_9AGAR|nr:hypothetical protein DXG03_005074 [Asterophora parasitica]
MPPASTSGPWFVRGDIASSRTRLPPLPPVATNAIDATTPAATPVLNSRSPDSDSFDLAELVDFDSDASHTGDLDLGAAISLVTPNLTTHETTMHAPTPAPTPVHLAAEPTMTTNSSSISPSKLQPPTHAPRALSPSLRQRTLNFLRASTRSRKENMNKLNLLAARGKSPKKAAAYALTSTPKSKSMALPLHLQNDLGIEAVIANGLKAQLRRNRSGAAVRRRRRGDSLIAPHAPKEVLAAGVKAQLKRRAAGERRRRRRRDSSLTLGLEGASVATRQDPAEDRAQAMDTTGSTVAAMEVNLTDGTEAVFGPAFGPILPEWVPPMRSTHAMTRARRRNAGEGRADRAFGFMLM